MSVSDCNSIATIKVDNLFYQFSFDLSFDSKENVSILIAPNGYGKTTLFHFINFLLYPSYESYMSILGIPFRRIACIMKDGSEYGVAQGKCKEEDTSEEVQKILSSQHGHLFYWYKENGETVHIWCLDKILKDNLSLYKRSLSCSIDIKTKDNNPKALLDCLFSALRNMLSSTSVKFIPADRLFASEERINKIYPDLNLNNMNDTFSGMIQAAKDKYAQNYIRIMNQYIYDFTYANLSGEYYYQLGASEKTEEIEKRLLRKWTKYSKKVQTYFEQDLLPESYDAKIELSKLDMYFKHGEYYADSYLHKNERLIIIDKLLTCLLEALMPIDELYRKFELFMKIINERLKTTNKKICLYQGRLIVQSETSNEKMELSILSSGEKNDLFLFYELNFAAEETGLVLIDEPEISWHIEWQMSFIDRLQEICEMNHFQAIVATHSPSIINDHIGSIVERVNKKYV